ncbi:hypothetical protein [Kitasatospora sp. NPDC058397]|uniref:hypothetical protein n=1 Tax=unclassified Kitasatospora TaxID=2633591 RepID=UPI00364C0B27
MSIHQQVASAREQLTGESLRGARLRVEALADWSVLIPAPTETQSLLESLLLQRIGSPTTPSRFPLGIAEVVPQRARLDVWFESPEFVSPVLELLPYRDTRKSVRGIKDLWAKAVGTSVEIAFARNPDCGVLVLKSLEKTDLGSVLSDYQSQLESRRRTPLWSIDPSALPPLPFRNYRRGRPRRATEIDHHNSAGQLASAVLRRIRLWDRLAGHISLNVSTQLADHGLDWQITRGLTSGSAVHDERLVSVLQDPIAGPGLVVDLANHDCSEGVCVLRFVAPSRFPSGWASVLTVRTVIADAPAVRRSTKPRSFEVLGEVPFPSRPGRGGGSAVVPDVVTRGGPAADADRSQRVSLGRCIQLLAPRFSKSPWELRRAATQIGAAWALQGDRVLVLTTSQSDRPSRIPRRYGEPEWPTAQRPMSPADATSWRRLRIVPGEGDLYDYTSYGYRSEMQPVLTRARQEFDWIVFSDGFDDHGMGPYVDEHADDYLVLVGSGGYETTVTITESRDGDAVKREIPLSAAEAAMAWRERNLTCIPFDRVPISGLILQQPMQDIEVFDDFVYQVDAELARWGTPVLARLPYDGPMDRSGTVLDAVSEQYQRTFLEQCALIKSALSSTRSYGPPIHSKPGQRRNRDVRSTVEQAVSARFPQHLLKKAR